LKILRLEAGEYVNCDRSPLLPMIEKQDLYQFLEMAFQDEVTAELNLRQWIREQQDPT
jgi:hypothetical protein